MTNLGTYSDKNWREVEVEDVVIYLQRQKFGPKYFFLVEVYPLKLDELGLKIQNAIEHVTLILGLGVGFCTRDILQHQGVSDLHL
jgi:hypothetical protein